MSRECEDRLAKLQSAMDNFEVRLSEADAPKTIEEIRRDYNIFKREVLDSISVIKSGLQECSDQLDKMEAYSRKNCLVLHGVTENQNEDTVSVALETLKKLSIPDFSYDYRIVDNCHRLRSNKSPRPIIIKFVSYLDRKKVWMHKKHFKGTKVFLTESLTKKRAGLFRSARDAFGKNKCFTRDGDVVVILPTGKKLTVTTESQLRGALGSLSNLKVNTEVDKEKDKEKDRRYYTRQATIKS